MFAFSVRKLFYSVLVILGVVTVVFFIMNLLPDPARLMQGQRADLTTQTAIRHELGLDLPVWQRYINFVSRAIRFDYGRSYTSNLPVYDSIIERLPATALLALSSMFIATIIGIAIGILSAKRPYSFFDNASMLFALFGISIPSFVMGLLGIVIFALALDYLPVSGYV